jgi:hypothetical protein
MLHVVSCSSSGSQQKVKESIDDFGFTGGEGKPPVVDEADLQQQQDESINSQLAPSSLPLPIKVGKGQDMFDKVPGGAAKVRPAVFPIRIKKCVMELTTETIQIDRYLGLVDGNKIKLKEGLNANLAVNLEKGMELYFKINARVMASIPQKSYKKCSQELIGKKVFLGQYHVKQTMVQLLAAPGSPAVHVRHMGGDNGSERLYLKWDIKSKQPMLIDQFDLPVYLESDFYHMVSDKDGYYYLKVIPRLVFLTAPKMLGPGRQQQALPVNAQKQQRPLRQQQKRSTAH